MTNSCQCNGGRIFLVSKQNTYKNVSVVNCLTSCTPTLRNLSTQLIMSQSIHLHAYSDRARLSESVVYEYNQHINKLCAWAWYVIKNSPFDHNLTSIMKAINCSKLNSSIQAVKLSRDTSYAWPLLSMSFGGQEKA